MAKKINYYPVDSVVKIKPRKRMPAGWNSSMMGLCGQTYKIVNTRGIPSHDGYFYYLNCGSYIWRHIDLILVKLAMPEPNRAFKEQRRHALQRH